ncbi:Hypothetical protein PHPALM_421 [Phytophthora palmivora]|uniref:Uncharacterized protein n=1 Tax=Phytophthora palmivora TaxID=4796 RepID=A0A2P4YUV4_9STRA|nr:Hypothetical protein PHPALM_421 [Phytophthora palmivora]
MSEELQEAVDGFFLAAEYGRSDVIKALADHGRGRLSLADVVDPVTGRYRLGRTWNEENRSAYALAQELKAQDLLLVELMSGPPDSSNSNLSLLDLHQLEKQPDEENDRPQQPQAQPLKLDAWTSKAQREQETFNRYVEKHGPDIWSTVWNGIWTGNEESEAQDEDGEVIMTV